MFETTKSENEKVPLTINFRDVLPPAETVVSGAVLVRDNETLEDLTSEMIEGAVAITDVKVQAKIIAGSIGKSYRITFQGTTTSGYIFEDEILLKVTE